MKVLKLILIAGLAYVGIVVAFESFLGIAQPAGQDTMLITTFDQDEIAHDRVVSRLEYDGDLYIAANHWPRAWYGRVLANPRVDVIYGGQTVPHVAVDLSQEEWESVNSAHPLGFVVRFLTGFPPRRIIRLDPSSG